MTRLPFILVILASSSCVASTATAQLESGEPATSLELEDWATGLSQVTDVAFLSDGRAIITRKTGEIAVAMPDGQMQNEQAARIEVDDASEKGLLGVVRDDQNRLYFYASTGDDDKDKHKVYRATVDASGKVSVDLSKSIIGNGLEGPANHDGGGMVIHKGQLYVGVGDTGFNASPPTNKYGTCLNKPNAKILRVELDGSIPADNPLVNVAQVTGCASQNAAFAMLPPDKRIYAWGLRNPWRLWIDPKTDLLWIGYVGEITQEEITVGGKGAHHGWPFFEGTKDHGELGGLDDCMDVVPASACVPAQHGYPRSDGVSVTGGLIPTEGCGWGAFEQRYFFADFESDRVWTLDVKSDRSGVVADSRKPFGRVPGAVSFRMGPDGGMYVAAYGGGKLVRIAPKSVPASCAKAAPSPTPSTPGTPVKPTGDSGAGAPAAQPGTDSGASDGCSCNLAARRNPSMTGSAVALGLLASLRGRRLVRRRDR